MPTACRSSAPNSCSICRKRRTAPTPVSYTHLDEKEKKETSLPPLEQGQVLKLRELKSEQKFTQPPARYTEATLIKALEENGIGRPSTYAPIITTIIDRGYVERDQKKLKPTLLGRAVDGLMLEQFPHIVDVDFSAQMEKNLDKVESCLLYTSRCV